MPEPQPAIKSPENNVTLTAVRYRLNPADCIHMAILFQKWFGVEYYPEYIVNIQGVPLQPEIDQSLPCQGSLRDKTVQIIRMPS